MSKFHVIHINGYRAKGIYEAAAAIAYGTETHCAETLLEIGAEIDKLRMRLIDDARSMAGCFTTFADNLCARPRHDATPPTGYSTLEDIQKNAAKLETLRNMYHLVAGSMSKAYARVEDQREKRALLRDALERIEGAFLSAECPEEVPYLVEKAIRGLGVPEVQQ